MIDLYHYAPVYDDEFARNFFMRGHMNAAGYLLTSRMIASYIDYYVRKYPRLFSQVPFIGSELYRRDYES